MDFIFSFFVTSLFISFLLLFFVTLERAHFLTTLHTCLGLPHPIVANFSWCQCGHTIDNLDTHLFRCPCGSDCITAHNTLRDIIAPIALESGTHV